MTRRFAALAVVGVLAACSSGTDETTGTVGAIGTTGTAGTVTGAPTTASATTDAASTTMPGTTEDTTGEGAATSSEFVELGAVQEPIAMRQPGEFEPAEMPAPLLEGDGPLVELDGPVDLKLDWGTPCSAPATSTVVEEARGVGDGETLITVLTMTVSLVDHPRGFELDSVVTGFGGGLGGGAGAASTSAPIETRPMSVDDLVNVQRPVLLVAPDGFPLAARLRDGVGPGDDGYDFVADTANLVAKAMETFQDTAATWLTVWSVRGVAGPEMLADVAQSNGVEVTNQWRALGSYRDGAVHLLLAQQLERIPVGDQTASGTMQFEAIVDPSTLRPDVAMSWLRVSSDNTGEVQLDERTTTTFEWDDAVGCDA